MKTFNFIIRLISSPLLFGIHIIFHTIATFFILYNFIKYGGNITMYSKKFNNSHLIKLIDKIDEKYNPIPSRVCSHCNTHMSKGYCISGGDEYYCSSKCLHKHYTHKEWISLYNDGDSDSYWTEWED